MVTWRFLAEERGRQQPEMQRLFKQSRKVNKRPKLLTSTHQGDDGGPRVTYTLFPPEEKQEEADIWTRFLAMGQARGLEWAKKMVAAQGGQQPLEHLPLPPVNTDEVQPSDSGLCLLSEESVAAPAKRKRPASAAVWSKIKRAKKDMAENNLPEGPSASQTDSGPRRATKDNEEQEAAGASGVPLTDGGLAPRTIGPIAQEQISQPARSVACSPTLGASGQGLQVGLSKMMEAMHSFMASAKALAGLGMDEQGASSRRAGAGRVWGQDTNSPPRVQGEASTPGAEVADRVTLDTIAGGGDKMTVIRPDPHLAVREVVPGMEGTFRSSGENMEEGIHLHFLAAHIRQGGRRHNGTQQGGREAKMEEEG
ncbi:hypothetical protein NDU88_003567 [Pleurodeles waltl]|uniref:Uncharacterized protein n=1 Tax=Pleurodeles waltl TaxID=8319 RepID=A0AAV7SGB8_PLEWA|nr:hypothetical protein NDU88_003567 [Pleurodeles waltl]